LLGQRAAALIGDGLYGVDIKQTNGTLMVIEVNDNPNLDLGVEDAVLKDELYRRVLADLVRRIEARRR
jgi:glutathione synthase/RimK-type ligase-like ATP-grasp enzyme